MVVRTLLTGLLVLFVSLCNAEFSGSGLQIRQLGLADIPTCGITCVLFTAPISKCRLDDQDCICKDVELAQAQAACMLANCTMADTLVSARVQADLCNFSRESKQSAIFMYTGILYALAWLLIGLRVAGKVVSNHVALDDWIVVTALLILSIPVACVLAMTHLGLGKHLWDLGDGILLRILRFFYISSSTYVIVLGLIKISLILFYLEIFKMRAFRISAYVFLAYLIINTLVIFLLTAVPCLPVEAFWDRDIKGKCLDVQALAYANSASAIFQDVVLLILPLVFIQKLQMRRNRKIAVSFMFAIGTFGCIATFIRLRTLLTFRISIDPTWDYVPVTIWTEIELACGFVCVSLPQIRILIVRFLPSRVKELLSHITSRSRSRSHSNPAPNDQPREWNKPSSWANRSQEANDSGHGSGGGRSLGSLWTRNSATPSTHRHMRIGSQRLESAMSNYTDADVAVTRPPYHDKRQDTKPGEVELLNIPKPSKSSGRNSLMSHASRDSRITALPPISRIGCLPEGSFSQLEVSKKPTNWARKWKKDDHV
ncbi:hypothetical protein GQ44DRAFT_615438 [Phaeosphaeriaceae sp. PMI808]|nr:hypothetical protein GQ44DRAFT_615438 [Phaeosphaeriaceae sp. PMI808]